MPCDKCCNRKDAGCLGSTWLEESQCSRTWSYSGRRNIVGGWMVMKKPRFFQIRSYVCSRVKSRTSCLCGQSYTRRFLSSWNKHSNQFSQSVQKQLCPTFCNAMDWSIPGFPVHQQLLELAQTHVHRISDAIQPFHPLSSPSPPALNLSRHQGLFQGVSSSHQVPKVLEFQLQQ